MRFARKMLLLVVAAAAVMALAAPTASATEQIEVTKADGTTHCPTLAAGGCKVHAQGEITLFFHIVGFEGKEATCRVEFRGETDEDGNGRINSQHIDADDHDPDCSEATSPPCTGTLPWQGNAEEDDPNGTPTNESDDITVAHYDVCTDPAESGACSGEFIATVTESGTTTESQTQTANDLRVGNSFCELTISETSEAVAPEGEETHIKSN